MTLPLDTIIGSWMSCVPDSFQRAALSVHHERICWIGQMSRSGLVPVPSRDVVVKTFISEIIQRSTGLDPHRLIFVHPLARPGDEFLQHCSLPFFTAGNLVFFFVRLGPDSFKDIFEAIRVCSHGEIVGWATSRLESVSEKTHVLDSAVVNSISSSHYLFGSILDGRSILITGQ
jgi:hypothetical protein